jgi:hypothetical protein
MDIITHSFRQQQCHHSMPTMAIILEPTGKQMWKHEMAGHRIMLTEFSLFMNSERRICRRYVTEWVDTRTRARKNLRNIKLGTY